MPLCPMRSPREQNPWSSWEPSPAASQLAGAPFFSRGSQKSGWWEINGSRDDALDWETALDSFIWRERFLGAIHLVLIGTSQAMIQQNLPQPRGNRGVIGDGSPATENSRRTFDFLVVKASTIHRPDQLRCRILAQDLLRDLPISRESRPGPCSGPEPGH